MNKDEDKEGFKTALLFLSSLACVTGPERGRREGRDVWHEGEQQTVQSFSCQDAFIAQLLLELQPSRGHGELGCLQSVDLLQIRKAGCQTCTHEGEGSGMCWKVATVLCQPL